MSKSYADLMNDISADELYERLLAYGLFADKLPPILSSVDFYNYCKNINAPYATLMIIHAMLKAPKLGKNFCWSLAMSFANLICLLISRKQRYKSCP